MHIIKKVEHPEQYTITELKNGEVYRLPSAGTIYLKIGTADTPYNNVNLANGVLDTISETDRCLLKVEGAFVENYKSDDDPDFVKEQLVAKQKQCNQFWDAQQNLKKDYWNLERRLEDQEKQLAERAMSIERLRAERDQLQSMYDNYQTRYAKIEKAYKDLANDSDNLLKQIIDAAYLGEMKGLEGVIMENPQRLLDKIKKLANTARPLHTENTTE